MVQMTDQKPPLDADVIARRSRGLGIRAMRRTELWKILKFHGIAFNERKDDWETLVEKVVSSGITPEQAAEAFIPRPKPTIGEKAHASVDIEKAPRPVLMTLCKEAGRPVSNTATAEDCRVILRGLYAS